MRGGKYIAKSKGVHREAESGGIPLVRCKEITYKAFLRGIGLQNKVKSNKNYMSEVSRNLSSDESQKERMTEQSYQLLESRLCIIATSGVYSTLLKSMVMAKKPREE